MALNEFQKELLKKPIRKVFDYVPVKDDKSLEANFQRQIIFDFKKGKPNAVAHVAELVINLLESEFTRLDNVVFACIPASSAEATAERYEEFSRIVCSRTGLINAYKHIKVDGKRVATHFFKRHIPIASMKNVSLDFNFFNGKDVIVFDDIFTYGTSFALFSDEIEGCGGNVMGGCFLGKTKVS